MGLAIRQRREKLNLTQEQLALKAGVSRSWLAKVETGKMSFDLRKVLMVLDVMGLRLEVEDV
ncbi:MAG: helix-turn-helix domain-containing protein [Bifidobacterium aquikefiri]|nr:helix-turn-helix domain-containing protein [Bifidobacterium aquikefiri]